MKIEHMLIYDKSRTVPNEAKKPIQGGRLKGMTDINPMWRIKKLTELFGPCGLGWYYQIIDKRIEEGANGEKIAFVDIEMRVKYGEEFSMPICGTGGSSFIAKEKNGLYTSDEAFKMALTDAISVSCKALGIGADVYFEKDRSKYDGDEEVAPKKPLSDSQIKRLYAIGKAAGYDAKTVKSHVQVRFNKKVEEMTKAEYDAVCKGYEGKK